MSATADVSRFLQGVRQVSERQINAARMAVGQYAAMVVTNAKEITPVEWGDLKRSIIAAPVQVNGYVITCTVGSNLNYAAAVHERGPDIPRHKPPTSWKFLEFAMKELDSKFVPFVADAIANAG